MEPIASFSGLASGIDFRSMIDQIMLVESRPIQLYQQQIDEAEARAEAWATFRSGVKALDTRAAELADASAFDAFTTSVTHLSSAGGPPLAATAGAGAVPGSYQVQVQQLASREKVGSDVFSSRTEVLGLEGEFLVNGVSVLVGPQDSMDDVVEAINRANTGSNASGVTASVLFRGPDAYSIVLTADQTGADGVGLADGADGVLRSLGFLDGILTVKSQTSDGAISDAFSNPETTVATGLGLTVPPASAAVTIGGFGVTVDLATMSLEDTAQAINTAASGAGSSVSAAVVSETDEGGDTVYRLDVNGTTSFADANGILEMLGILQAGRSEVSQVVSSGNAFTDGDASTVATASTRLRDIWVKGADADLQDGDTLSIAGTRGDGTTFELAYTLDGGDRLQDLLDFLNSDTEGFQAGDRTATVSISTDGRLVVEDDTAGGSWLNLEIVANNEGGGTLDFGAFAVTQTGRAREIAAGQDALIQVDGSTLQRSSNVVSDVIPGVTLQLLRASDTVATVEVAMNAQVMAEDVQAFVQAYNELAQWVSDQFSGAGAQEGASNPPLSSDSVLRVMRNSLRDAMLTELAASMGGEIARFADIGVEINRDGLFDVDVGKLMEALERDPAAVHRLFGVHGSGSTSSLSYVEAGSETVSGTYDVEITQAATQGAVTGTGFSGTYVDDGTADTLTVRDLNTDSEYSVALANGMTMAEIVAALDTEFGTARSHQLQASQVLYGDAVGTAATESTVLADLFDAGGVSLGVADGDVFTLSGTRADGSSFHEQFAVSDVNTQSLGDLRVAVENAVGSGEEVTWDGGLLTVSALEQGRSSLAFSISSDNAGGGNLEFGTMDVVAEGRGTVDLNATDSGGQLSLHHTEFGSANGFEVSFTPGGVDGSASLGVGAGVYAGLDVQGTIGGMAASGTGQILTGSEDTSVEGLMIRYEGADTGVVGSMTFSRGVASAIEVATDLLLGSGEGSIDALVANIDPLVDRLNDRINTLEGRLERRRDFLIAKFARLEEALAMAQSQSQWLSAQFANLPSYSSKKD